MLKKIKYTKRPVDSELKEVWYLIDAEGKTLGRLATKIATILMGKDKATYDPAMMNKTKIVVINSAKIKVTGNKANAKVYKTHSGYIGGLHVAKFSDLMVKKPTEAIRHAVAGMLPKNKLRALRMEHLRVFAGNEHVHSAQQPVKLEL